MEASFWVKRDSCTSSNGESVQGIAMKQPTFWLVLDQGHDGVAECLLPSHAETTQLAVVQALEHCDGKLMGVVHGSHKIASHSLCLMCTAMPLRLESH